MGQTQQRFLFTWQANGSLPNWWAIFFHIEFQRTSTSIYVSSIGWAPLPLTPSKQQGESVEEAHLLLKSLGQEVTHMTSAHVLVATTSLMER